LGSMLAACTQAPPASPVSVVSHHPAVGATDVPVDTDVAVTFDGPLDQTELGSGSLRLRLGDLVVRGTVTYDADTYTLRFDPTVDLVHGATYTATLGDWVAGPDGAAVTGVSSWDFTTVPAPEQVPTADEPAGGGEEAPGEAEE